MYETISFVSGVAYLSLFPLLVFQPEFTFKYLLFNADIEVYGTEENIKAMEAVFAMLMIVIAPPYLASAIFGYTTYVDLTILQRCTIVFAAAFLTGRVLHQDVFSTGNFSYTMFLIGDVVPAILQALVAPGGLDGIKSKCFAMLQSQNERIRISSKIAKSCFKHRYRIILVKTEHLHFLPHSFVICSKSLQDVQKHSYQ